MQVVNNAGQNVLRLEWQGDPDYLDLLQSRNQLEVDGWTEVERFSGTAGTLTKEIPATGPAAFYRVQRALK
jgi:hypothetical protein